jgi:uncharacterized protein YecT (DUF1311 family)
MGWKMLPMPAPRHFNRVFASLLLSGFCYGHICFAADEISSCKNAATTAAMRACEDARYKAADQQLNAVYNRLIRELDKRQQEKLRLAQRAWIQFRDANADFVAARAEGGTLAPLLKITALADMTEVRAQELMRVRIP